MNRLTVQALAARIASTLGITPEAAEQLIHDYFVDVAERLQRGETVDIDNLGKFAAGGESLFTPLPDVAARINEPFAFFEPVELNDGVTAETLDLTTPAIPEPSPAPEPERIEEPEPERIEEPAPEPEIPKAPEAPIIPNFPQAPEPPEPSEPSEPSEPHKGHCANALAAWATGCLLLGLTIGGLTGYWVGRHTTLFPTSPAEPVEKVEPTTTLNDTSATSITSATSATPVTTDTVRADYYITDMARKYYGNKDFWSYIYEENADSLGHPEHIHPGQILVIPDAAKYGIDPDNKESLKRARALAIDIYGRYN